MRSSNDTIAAIATPSGPGGVGIVRISGSSAIAVLEALSNRGAEAFEDRKLILTSILQDGAVVDETLSVVMRGPRSFTGEDVVEIHGHGGSVNLARLLRAVLSAGARTADPGEFTRRAVENGCLDLAQAEAIMNIANATSERGLRVAHAQREGALTKRASELRLQCAAILSQIEATIDFPEDSVEEAVRAHLAKECNELAARCTTLADSYHYGKAVTRGVSVVISGPVNSGKSSLLNAFAGEERALVSDEPGTTRDLVETQVSWQGVQISLTDTAGLRDDPSALEQRGYELARRRLESADLNLLLIPPGETFPSPQAGVLMVRSKADLCTSDGLGQLAISVVEESGLEKLKATIVERLAIRHDHNEGEVVTNERHRDLLVRCSEYCSTAAKVLSDGLALELAPIELREAQTRLGELTGIDVHDEVLDQLFSSFCIGK